MTLNFDHETEQGILALAADGATQSNTLQGKRSASEGTGVALGYWEATHGCGNGRHNDETTGDIAFSIAASSDGSKTYSDYDGDSAAVCANLPSEPSIADCPEFSERWPVPRGTVTSRVKPWSNSQVPPTWKMSEGIVAVNCPIPSKRMKETRTIVFQGLNRTELRFSVKSPTV